MMSNEHAGLGAGRTGVKVQGGENAFHLREQQLKIMIETCIYKPRSNHKPKSVTDTHTCVHTHAHKHKTSSKCTRNIVQDSVLGKLWTATCKRTKPFSHTMDKSECKVD